MKNEVLEKVLKAHKNLIVEGDIGSGKTMNVLFPIVDKAIENKESLFILDSKEEYINKYYNKLKENDYNTIIINLRNLDNSEGWNPLEYIYNLYKNGNSDISQEHLEKIVKIMFHEDSRQDPYWSIMASDFFTGIALSLFEDGKAEEINFNSINNIIYKRSSDYYLTTYFNSKDATSKPYIFASPTILAPKETRESILSIVSQKLRLFASREKLSQLMNKTTFSFDEVANKPTAIIFIARDDNKSLNDLVDIFIEQLYSILIEKKIKNKFNLILDNFDIVENYNGLVDILGSCISRKIKVYIATRSLNDLSDQYGSYTVKLCDLIKLGSNDIKLIISDIEETTEKDFEKVIIKEADINYPTLKTNKIELFDLESYVNKIEPKKLTNLDFQKLNEKPFNVDDVLKRIDEQLEQLEIEERIENGKKSNINIKSELEQFKIEGK